MPQNGQNIAHLTRKYSIYDRQKGQHGLHSSIRRSGVSLPIVAQHLNGCMVVSGTNCEQCG